VTVDLSECLGEPVADHLLGCETAFLEARTNQVRLFAVVAEIRGSYFCGRGQLVLD